MAQYDTPPLVDPTTGRIPTYKQVMVQDSTTGTYKVKYEYTKIASTSTAGADLTSALATPITEMTGYGTGTGDDSGGGGSGGGDSGEDSGTGDGTDGGTTTSAMNREGRDRNTGTLDTERFNIGTASVADLSGVLNPSMTDRVVGGLFTALAPTGLSAILGVGSAYQKGEVVKELNARAKAGTLGTNPETGALATNKELTAMLGNLSKSYGLFNNVDFSAELQKQITAANMVDAFSLTDDSTSVASQWANPVSEDELSDMLDATMTTNTGATTPTYDGDYNQMPAGFVDGDTPSTPTASMRSSEAYNRMEAAVTDGDVSGAIDAAKTSAGFAGSSRDTAERNMNDAAIGAGTNNENANYGANETSSQRRERENSEGIGAAREAASNSEREAGTSVDRNNAVDNAARSNEVSDKHGNAVTNTNRNTNVTTAVNTGSKKNTGMKTRADVARDKAAKQKANKDKGGDKPGRIICTELYRQGLISREDYMLDLYYTSKHLTSQHTAGYWHFAVPAVKAMRRSKFWTAFWREIAYNRLQDIKWRLGYGKFTLKGRIYSAIFEPFCYISGYFKPNATYKELYKGEY